MAGVTWMRGAQAGTSHPVRYANLTNLTPSPQTPLTPHANPGVPSQLGWAFGLGLERIAMLLFSIPDIRLFWSQDPRFLSQFSTSSPTSITRFTPFSKHPSCYKDV